MRIIKQIGIMTLLVFGALFGVHQPAQAQERTIRPDLAGAFEKHNLTGTFVLYDLRHNRLILVNPDRAARRMYPASTFKITNSLIALETGVIADAEEVIPYGGKPQPIKAWEKDMSMREAIKVSNVPIYQELARRIGPKRYQSWLDKFGYGNREIGADVETFWLKGPLSISAIEQVRFLARLVDGHLPVSQRAQDIVTDIMTLEKGSDWALHGKSGWSVAPDPDIGWLVGWVRTEDDLYTFALNIDMRSRADRNMRMPLVRHFLQDLGLAPNAPIRTQAQ